MLISIELSLKQSIGAEVLYLLLIVDFTLLSTEPSWGSFAYNSENISESKQKSNNISLEKASTANF